MTQPSCTVDTDCTVGGTACGTEVCDFGNRTCVPAASSPGWCTTTADCKCACQGAICAYPHCTLLEPLDASDDEGVLDGSVSIATVTAGCDASFTSYDASAYAISNGSATGAPDKTNGGCAIGFGPGSPWWTPLFIAVAVALLRRYRAPRGRVTV